MTSVLSALLCQLIHTRLRCSYTAICHTRH